MYLTHTKCFYNCGGLKVLKLNGATISLEILEQIPAKTKIDGNLIPAVEGLEDMVKFTTLVEKYRVCE